jgi:acetate kinase
VSFLGLALDQTRNLGVDGDEIISADESIVRVLVVRARENWMVANDALRVIA